MNKEKMLQLADFLYNLDESRFNMGYWYGQYDDDGDNLCQANSIDLDNCNTVACIAGWAVALETNGEYVMQDYFDGKLAEKAQEILDLSRDEADMLFYTNSGSIWLQYANDLGIDYYYEDGYRYLHQDEDITAKDASFVLRQLVNGEMFFNHSDDEDDDDIEDDYFICYEF